MLTRYYRTEKGKRNTGVSWSSNCKKQMITQGCENKSLELLKFRILEKRPQGNQDSDLLAESECCLGITGASGTHKWDPTELWFKIHKRMSLMTLALGLLRKAELGMCCHYVKAMGTLTGQKISSTLNALASLWHPLLAEPGRNQLAKAKTWFECLSPSITKQRVKG